MPISIRTMPSGQCKRTPSTYNEYMPTRVESGLGMNNAPEHNMERDVDVGGSHGHAGGKQEGAK